MAVTQGISEFRQNFFKIRRELEEKQKTKTTVVVHLGKCGAAVGAEEVLEVLKKKNKEYRTEDKVEVGVAGCIGLCSQEPLIRVSMPGKKDAVYSLVTSEKAEVIFSQHILKGIVIQPWLLARQSPT